MKKGEKDREEERRRESDISETELLHRCNTDRNQLKQEPKGSKLQYFYKVSIRNRIYSKSAGKPCWRAPTLTPLYPNTKNSKKGTSQKKNSKTMADELRKEIKKWTAGTKGTKPRTIRPASPDDSRNVRKPKEVV